MKKSRIGNTLLMAALFAVVVICGLAAVPHDALAAASPFGFEPSAQSLSQLALVGSVEQLRRLAAQRTTAVDAMTAITTAAAGRADGNLTDDERQQFDAHAARVKAIDGDIERINASMAAQRTVEIPDNARIETRDNQRDAANHGFGSFGEFAIAVMHAGLQDGKRDPRLVAGSGLPSVNAASTAPSSYINEGNGADGGYLVPPEFSNAVVQTAYNQNDSFVPMTDNTPVSGNGMTFPVDETTPWGSSGIKAYWTDEAGAGTESKIKLDPAQLRLKKLTALVPLTEEMLADAAAIGAYVQKKTPEAIAFKTNEALWGGSGAGKPKGYYTSSGVLVTISKEVGQAADTIVAQNISKMRARMSARSWRRAIWTINNDALPQLDTLVFATAATNGVIYKPEGGRFGYGSLLGRDVMVTDFNETVGDKGDIVLVDWGMYRTITKAGGVETATSMHFWFDRGLTAFRTIFRIDGQPAIQSPVTPNKGSNTLSPIVTLEART